MLENRLALFDLDYTILDGDSEAMWCHFLYEKKIVDQDFLARIADYYHAYEQGKLDIHEYEATLLAPMTRLPLEELEILRKEYLQHVKRAVRGKIVRRINRFRTLGFTLLLITAANNFIAEPIAEFLRFPNLLCTQIKKVDGRLTTQLDGTPAFREGKVTRLEEWMDLHGMSLRGSWGYSDSHNDLPLLQKVEHPIAVFPDAALRNHARQNGWKIIDV